MSSTGPPWEDSLEREKNRVAVAVVEEEEEEEEERNPGERSRRQVAPPLAEYATLPPAPITWRV